jgi:hypothetical protein
VNINPADPRIWVTSDTFATLLERFGRDAGLLTTGQYNWATELGWQVLELFQPGRPPSVYDRFMRRFRYFLKSNEEF